MDMVEMCKDALERGYVCAMFMYLSKAFDTVNHNLWINKLEANGFEGVSLSFLIG